MSQDMQLFKNSRVPDDFWRYEDVRRLEANLRFGFFDNSLKPDTDYGFLDWMIFAGTPEWCNARVSDLYERVTTYSVPTMILGVGGGYNPYKEVFRDVIEKSKVFVVRDEDTFAEVSRAGYQATHLPCPALLSADRSFERVVTEVKNISLIYQATIADSVIWNGYSMEAHDFVVSYFLALMKKFGGRAKFNIVCHYIDEIPLAMKLFPDVSVNYSYNAEDYYDIYGAADFVIGPRVHGIGIAASMGIPGVAITHDKRGVTCKGFLAEILSFDAGLDEAITTAEKAIGNARGVSRALLRHKRKTMARYQSLVAAALGDTSISYISEASFKQNVFDIKELATRRVAPATGPVPEGETTLGSIFRRM
jgi:hypothetical protein